jgi:hypothetical protein
MEVTYKKPTAGYHFAPLGPEGLGNNNKFVAIQKRTTKKRGLRKL